jgi:hypothetical protein
MRGAPLKAVQELLGHAAIDMTMATPISALTYGKERLVGSMLRHMDGTWRKSRLNDRKKQWRRRESNPLLR